MGAAFNFNLGGLYLELNRGGLYSETSMKERTWVYCGKRGFYRIFLELETSNKLYFSFDDHHYKFIIRELK